MEKDRFVDIYRNLITKQTPLQMEEVIEFIDETIKIYSPKSKLDPNSIQVLIQTGLIEMAINACIDAIAKNPDIFNITTVHIYDNNKLIKIYVYNNSYNS